MKENWYLDDELFDKVEVHDTDGKEDNEIKEELKAKRTLKSIKIALYALLGGAAARLFYKAPDDKERNTNYLDKY